MPRHDERPPHRVRAWREAAQSVRESVREVSDVFRKPRGALGTSLAIPGSMLVPTVGRYMTKQPWTISQHATLAQAHALMREHRIRHLPVTDNGNLVGVVSVRDLHLLETVADFSLDSVEVGEAMTARPTVVTSDAALDEVTAIMADHKYGSVIVMGHGGIEGIITTIDICRALVDVLGEARDAEARSS